MAEYRKLLRKMVKEAMDQGWEVRDIKAGMMLIPPDPDAPMVTIHGTPSDHRAWLNIMTRMRRSGFRG